MGTELPESLLYLLPFAFVLALYGKWRDWRRPTEERPRNSRAYLALFVGAGLLWEIPLFIPLPEVASIALLLLGGAMITGAILHHDYR